MDGSQARKLTVLVVENVRPKRPLSDAMLDNAVLKEAAAKKLVRPAARRKAVEHARQLFGNSERRACTIFSVDRTSTRYAHRRSTTPRSTAGSVGGTGLGFGPCATSWGIHV
ncbi:hypothetical protein [Sphingomonas sp. BK580]|uniref:hypothetical protein n=1 Tax=Sphingomonas sp. BK580 TaxID=2586972 RepID=UPI00160E1663|nr:hypothetical protein [Sphingomonas sp. BK580]